MAFASKDPNVLKARWMEIYLNLTSLRSSDPEVENCLDIMRLKLAECNEWVMRFFDMVGATPKDVG